MCNFLSALWTRDGRLLTAPEYTDSHTDLVAHLGLADNRWPDPRFARVEFTPPADAAQIADLDKWTFRLDEEATPSWFDAESEAQCLDALRDSVSRMFVRDERPILMGGYWILLDGARVKRAIKCYIRGMFGQAEITEAVSTHVIEMRDNSHIDTMWDSSYVGTMWDSSHVGVMWGESHIGYTLGSSRVGTMWDSSYVGTMWDSSHVGVMWGSSQVGEMRGWSHVGTRGLNVAIFADYRVESDQSLNSQ